MTARTFVGTCSWTDPTLTDSDSFYPRRKMSAEERLRYYAENFNTVEVDSTFYALPSEKAIGLQTERTPDDFVLNYKAFGLLTKHTVYTNRLPKALKELLDSEQLKKPRLGPRDIQAEVIDLAFQMFGSALLPADSAGKLGAVLFQFPPYFVHDENNKEYLLRCQRELSQYQLAVEFRHPSWLTGDNERDTLDFLEANSLAYVCVDEPQFRPAKTMPPTAAVTAPLAYVRMHGRNSENWFRKRLSPAERFSYLYSDAELAEWLPKLNMLREKSERLFVMFNNCYSDYAVRNARRMAELLSAESRKKES